MKQEFQYPPKLGLFDDRIIFSQLLCCGSSNIIIFTWQADKIFMFESGRNAQLFGDGNR